MEKHEHRAQECLNHMVRESLEVVARMHNDVQEWKHQWKLETAGDNVDPKEGGAQACETTHPVSNERMVAEQAKLKAGWCMEKIVELEKRHE